MQQIVPQAIVNERLSRDNCVADRCKNPEFQANKPKTQVFIFRSHGWSKKGDVVNGDVLGQRFYRETGLTRNSEFWDNSQKNVGMMMGRKKKSIE